MKFLNKILYIFLFLILTNCNADISSEIYKPLRFTKDPYKFDVSKIIIDTEKNSIDVHDRNSQLLLDALKIWVNDRLIANGENKILKIVIKNAKITNYPDEQYQGDLSISLEIYDEDLLFPVMESNFELSHTSYIQEDATIYERQSAVYEIIKKLISNFNQDIDNNIINYFGRFLSISN
ncbi:MAG: hypothetical protein ACK4OM_00465 [Alphaproteobacteria bacterium]